MARRGSHWGSFGKGFMDAFLAAYKVSMMADYYKSREDYMAARGRWYDRQQGKGALPQGEIDAANRDRAGWGHGVDAPASDGGGYKGGAGAEAHAGEMSDYLQQTYGLSKAGAAAMVGNAWQENSFRTGIEATGDKDANGNYTSGGMFQWHGSRLVDARNWMQANNKDPADWRSHMDYAVHDMQVHNQGLLNYLKTTDDAGSATHTFFKRYEIGDPAQAHMGNRVGMANAVFSGAARTKTAKGTDTTEPAAKAEKVSAQVPPAGIHIPNVYTSSGKSSEYPAKTETGGTPTSQADLPPGNQVASLDDDEAMRIAIEQQNQSRSPDQRIADPATINEQAEQAGHYAFTHAGEQPPAPPVGAGPAIPISPQAGPGGPNPNFQPSGAAPPQVGPGGPNPTPGPMYGPPPPPSATPPSMTTRGPAADITNKLAGDETDERRWPIPEARPSTVPDPSRGGAAEITRPVVGGDERLRPATDANAPSADASPVAAVTPQSNSPAIPTNPRFVMIDRPNAPAERGPYGSAGGGPKSTALNLSWGPNPPLADREAKSNNIVLASSQGDRAGQTVSAPMPPPRPADDMVGTPDMASLDDTTFDATAARKGGPMRPAIPRYAGGGGVMGYATGGTTLGTPATMAQLTSSAYAGPTAAGGWIGTPYGQLAPNQQAWADQQTAEIGKIRSTADPSSLVFTMMPDAVWPTAPAPATPTTVNQPPPVVTPISTPTVLDTTNDAATGGTTTGAYQLPDVVAPTTTPNTSDNTTTVNPTPKIPSTLVPNTPGTGASDVGATDTTKKTTGDTSDQTGSYAGFQRGGIPRRPTRGRYAGGGMVTNFAAGGGAPTSAMLASPGWQNTASTYTTGPNAAPLTNQQLYDLQNTINAQPAGMFMGSYSDWLTGANNSQNPAGASRDLTNYYGAYTMPAPAAAAPTTVAQPAPVVTPVSTPTAISTTNDAATGGTTTGAYQLPDVVAPASTPALDTTQNTTTVNPTPKTPTTIVPNITTSGGGVGIDQPTTTVKPLKTPSTTGTGGTGTSDVGNTNYADTSDQTGAYAGFSRGGIPRRPTLGRYAGGGGVMGYAAGASVQPQQVSQAMNSLLFGPGAPYSQQDVLYGRPDQTVGGMYEANLAALTPEQQAWYNANDAALQGYSSASGAAGSSYTAPTGERGGQGPTVNQGQLALANNQMSYYQSQFNLTPPAAKAAAAAAATSAATTPAPVVAPTLTAISTPTVTSTTSDAATGGTTTGAYQLPDIVAPTSTPTSNQTGTTVNPAAKVPTTTVPNTPSNTNASDIGSTDNTKKQTPTAGDVSSSSGAYAGFRRGGIIGHNGAMRYDDGGGVSPAPAGMLPGMGGAQPVPPIYYNPATYAGAGAPVGKGVTATSAPTYVAGAIPSLPMFRGGVVGYDDGGDVQAPPVDDTGDMQQARYDAAGDQADEAEDNRMLAGQQAKTDAANAPITDTSPPRGDDWYYTPEQLTPQSNQSNQAGGQDRPPDPVTPQIKDDQGNPSNGFIGFLTSGLHWLGEHLGLVGGAQAAGIASNPETQTARRQFATNDPNGATYMTSQNMEEARTTQDPHDQLEGRYKDIAAMEGAYRWLMLNGREAEAGRMAASMLHYAVMTSQNLSEQAAKELYDGNIKGAVEYINKASDAVPDGRIVHAVYDEKTNTVSFEGKDLNGRTVWQTKGGAAEAILEHATALGRSGKLQWDALESQAAKYDSTFRDMAKNRTAAGKERYGDEQAVEAARKFAPPAAPPSDDTTAPTPAMPSVPTSPPTITAGGAEPTVTPAPVSTAGAAEGRSPPPTADSSGGVTPGGNTGAALAGLPARPTPGNIGETGNALAALPAPPNAPTPNAPTPDATAAATPAPQAQPASAEASFDQIVASFNKQEIAGRHQVELEAQQRFQPQYEAYPNPALVTNKADKVAFDARRGEVIDHNKRIDDARNKYIADGQKIISDQIAADRTAALEKFKTKSAAIAADVATTRATTAATTTDTRESKQKELQGQITRENQVFNSNLSGTAALTHDQKLDKVGTDYNPVVNIAKSFNPDATYANEGEARAAMVQLGIDTNTQNTLANIYDQGINHSGTTSPAMVGAAITAFVTGGEGAWQPEYVVPKLDAQGNVMRDKQGQPIPDPVKMHGVVRFDLTVADNSGNMVSIRLPQSEMGQLIAIKNRIAPAYTQTMSKQLARDVHSKGLMALPPRPGMLPMGMGVQSEDEDATPQRDIPGAIMNMYSVPF